MIKKIISFIVIFIAYMIIGVALVLGTSNFGLGYGTADNNDLIGYSYALDRAGNIYYISDDGASSLVMLDSSGKKLLEKKLDTDIFGEHFYINDIYVDHDKGIYLTSYKYDSSTLFVTEASIHLFLEDGTYSDMVFSQKLMVYPNGSTGIISSLSEDDNKIYFSVLNGSMAEVFSLPKDNSEPAAKIKDYNLDETAVYGWFTTPTGDVIVGGKDGIRAYTDTGVIDIDDTKGSIFDSFWNGIGLYYAMDSSTGDINVISSDYGISSVVSGDRILNVQHGVSISDMSEVTLGITGNILGVVRDSRDTLFLGSFSLMSEIFTNDIDNGEMINIVLAIVAVAVAVILLSILTWDFYCSILKMRISILLRQSLLIAMLIFVGLYSLSFLVIIPQVEKIVTSNYQHEARLIANSFERSMTGVLMADGDISYRAYESYLEKFGIAAQINTDNETSSDDELPQVTLVEKYNKKARVVASSERFSRGYPANRILNGCNISDALKQADDNGGETFIISKDVDGERLFLVRRTDILNSVTPAYILVGIRLNGLSEAIDNIGTMINLCLVAGGALIVIFLMIIENITAAAVRKLKRSVENITSGNYKSTANIHTGDEIEDLSMSVNALSAHIVSKTTSLEKLNDSYYRFVPLGFLKNLGETKCERINKSLHTKKNMTTMLLHFSFSQPLTSMEPQEIFDSVNSVFEQITPVITGNNGTAYNFLSDGLNAIFPDSSENALQAAIRIREILTAFNEVQRLKGKRTVDVRIVIGKDEVLLGFVGDDTRMESTAVSTAINESVEIEKICVDSGLYIVMTESAYLDLPSDKYRSRCIGIFNTEASGEKKLYDLFDSDPYSLIKLKEQFISRFEVGVNLFEKKDFVNARNMFMDIVKYASDDGVSRNYMYLAEHNLGSENKNYTYSVFNK